MLENASNNCWAVGLLVGSVLHPSIKIFAVAVGIQAGISGLAFSTAIDLYQSSYD
jgi:hypothetical protein